MFDIEEFINEIRELDRRLSTRIPNSMIMSFEDYRRVAEKIWVSPIKSLFDNNLDSIRKNLPEILKALDKEYKYYVSPIFTAYISHLVYDDFPYEVSLIDFKNLVKDIKKARHPEKIHDIADSFRRKHILTTEEYMFRKLFRPYHPIYYLLQDLKKSVELTFKVDADRVIEGVAPYLVFPHNKNTKELQFALGFSAGLSMSELMSIEKVRKVNKWTIEYSTLSGENNIAWLIFGANEWIRAFKFLQACELSANQARQSLTEIPRYIIGVPLSNKLIPALHSALVRHFHGEKYAQEINSKSSIDVRGKKPLEKIVEVYIASRKEVFKENVDAASDSVRGLAICMNKLIEDDPTIKMAIRTIQERTGVSKVTDCQKVNDLFWETYAPVETRPTRSEKEKREKRSVKSV